MGIFAYNRLNAKWRIVLGGIVNLYRFRLKLTVVMIVFAIVIALGNTIVDYYRLKEKTVEYNELQVKQIEETIINSIENIEKAYYFFEKDTEKEMESTTHYLIDLYKQNPNFDEWDFTSLKNEFHFDIYILNDQNEIIHSSFTEDIGLNFTKCCKKLAKILDERRNDGGFFSDGMDMEQATGNIKKYSYMATPDKKFLIELSYSLQEGTIFSEFNFLNVKSELEQKYSSLNEVNILNLGGFSLGKPVAEGKLPKERKKAFEETIKTNQPVELTKTIDDSTVVYRYVPYVSAFDVGSTKTKVIEIVYNEQQLDTLLYQNSNSIVFQFLIIIIATVIIGIIISRWVSKPMYLAFHDSLTGLKNRAAFNELLESNIKTNKGLLALMIIDLDDFKLVNDHFGHQMGDRLLKRVANKIQSVIDKKDIAIRLGGDEFVIILPNTNENEISHVTEKVIEAINEAANQSEEFKGYVSASIGISIAPDHGDDPEILYHKADKALYSSKKKGKNQYQIYE